VRQYERNLDQRQLYLGGFLAQQSTKAQLGTFGILGPRWKRKAWYGRLAHDVRFHVRDCTPDGNKYSNDVRACPGRCLRWTHFGLYFHSSTIVGSAKGHMPGLLLSLYSVVVLIAVQPSKRYTTIRTIAYTTISRPGVEVVSIVRWEA
jgi:hypothetical protein